MKSQALWSQDLRPKNWLFGALFNFCLNMLALLQSAFFQCVAIFCYLSNWKTHFLLLNLIGSNVFCV